MKRINKLFLNGLLLSPGYHYTYKTGEIIYQDPNYWHMGDYIHIFYNNGEERQFIVEKNCVVIDLRYSTIYHKE